MGNLTSTDMVIVCALIGVIFVLVVIILVLDHFSKKKQKEEIESFEAEQNEQLVPVLEENLTSEAVLEPVLVETEEKEAEKLADIEEITTNIPKIVTNKVEEIRYVEEDEELEKTKAKLELQALFQFFWIG